MVKFIVLEICIFSTSCIVFAYILCDTLTIIELEIGVKTLLCATSIVLKLVILKFLILVKSIRVIP